MSSHEHPHGRPENVLGFTEDSKVFIHDAPLKDMFLHPDVKHRKIVAFSIIGAYRKGKSFFLDYCLRYLYAHYPSIKYPNNPVSDQDEWLGDEDEPLVGFSWRSGSDRDTTGIVMWNDIFLHTMEDTGEKIAILVMDTQGLFDNRTSPMDNTKIFALGTLISSIQVLNLVGVVQEDQLQYLQFATEFAKYAASSNQGMAGKCFQSLMFLIRDWDNPDEHQYGTEGGIEYLQQYLTVESNQQEQLKSVRRFIYDSFEELSCSLMPHPGKIVTGSRKLKKLKYDGRHKGMDEEFKDELVQLIDHLLNPKRLVPKIFNNIKLNGSEFFTFITNLFKVFQLPNLPQAQTIFESTVERQMRNLIDSILNDYKRSVKEELNLVTNRSMIQILHDKCKFKAILKFNETKKMGTDQHHAKFKDILEGSITKEFNLWKSQKENYFQELDDFREIQEAIELEKIEQLEMDNLLAHMKLKLNQLQHEFKLKSEEILKLEAIKKEKKIAALSQKMHEETLNDLRLNALFELNEINRKKENELQKVKSKQESTVYMTCRKCKLKIKFNDLNNYSKSGHDLMFDS